MLQAFHGSDSTLLQHVDVDLGQVPVPLGEEEVVAVPKVPVTEHLALLCGFQVQLIILDMQLRDVVSWKLHQHSVWNAKNCVAYCAEDLDYCIRVLSAWALYQVVKKTRRKEVPVDQVRKLQKRWGRGMGIMLDLWEKSNSQGTEH